MRTRIIRGLACLLLSAIVAAAGAQDISDLVGAFGGMLGTGTDDASTSDGGLIDQTLLDALTAAAGLSTPAPTLNAPTAPSPLPASKLCPVCGKSFPFAAAKPGTAWGMRLDLRLSGPVTDPPSLAICPSCGFPVYDETIQEPELGRLRAFVATEEFKTIQARHVPYYRLALIREKRIVQMNAGDYDIVHAYLQAAWQAEDFKDPEAVTLYLQKALQYAVIFARSCPPGDRYYPSSRLLPVELLRRLARFAEASSKLEAFEAERTFQAAYLQRIMKAEKALIDAEDSSPAPSP